MIQTVAYPYNPPRLNIIIFFLIIINTLKVNGGELMTQHCSRQSSLALADY